MGGGVWGGGVWCVRGVGVWESGNAVLCVFEIVHVHKQLVKGIGRAG